ncbi:MAG: hypothetical protein AWU58_331 [Methanohalophilus sp. T328-1]|nr:MAG: hypothetical protein AWU58_331 [Methanohalophilus sp. T328-1]
MFDKILPQQKSMSTKLGGLLVLVGETMFLFSLMNFLMITRLQYYSEGDSFIRTLFPHYLLFVIALFLVAFTGMWFAYVYILPSKQSCKFCLYPNLREVIPNILKYRLSYTLS